MTANVTQLDAHNLHLLPQQDKGAPVIFSDDDGSTPNLLPWKTQCLGDSVSFYMQRVQGVTVEICETSCGLLFLLLSMQLVFKHLLLPFLDL